MKYLKTGIKVSTFIALYILGSIKMLWENADYEINKGKPM